MYGASDGLRGEAATSQNMVNFITNMRSACKADKEGADRTKFISCSEKKGQIILSAVTFVCSVKIHK